MNSKPKTLVLYARKSATNTLSYLDDWKDAFLSAPEFQAQALNICDDNAAGVIHRTLPDYDLIVILHCVLGDTVEYIRSLIGELSARKAKLLSFVGNEGSNLPDCPMRDRLAVLKELRPEYIGTYLLMESARFVYGDIENCRIISVLHALNHDKFRPTIPQASRAVDIGVRCYSYTMVLGDNERNAITDYFQKTKFRPRLVTDIDTNYTRRFTRDKWAWFLNACKATVSTEAGSYYLEKDDATTDKIVAYMEEHCPQEQRLYNRLRNGRWNRIIPARVRRAVINYFADLPVEKTFRAVRSGNADTVSFEEIYDRFFKDYRGAVSGKVISSRHFDAIGTKTCQIMFPGRFNDILQADKHYIALNRDFSNIDDVLKRFRDLPFREKMVNQTYEYAMDCHTYRHRMQEIARLVS